jgi:hypothetical protein
MMNGLGWTGAARWRRPRPAGIGLKPDGDQLRDMESDKLSRRDRFRKELYREAKDIQDVSEKNVTDIASLLGPHPPAGHAETVARPSIEASSPPPVDAGSLATAGLALGLVAERAISWALIAATFFEAADQRFAAGHTKADIVEFVAAARASSPGAADKVDPLLAERMIGGVFEDESLGDVSGQVVVETQLLLLAALLGEARPGPAGLDALLAEGRKVADEWTS